MLCRKAAASAADVRGSIIIRAARSTIDSQVHTQEPITLFDVALRDGEHQHAHQAYTLSSLSPKMSRPPSTTGKY